MGKKKSYEMRKRVGRMTRRRNTKKQKLNTKNPLAFIVQK